MRVSRFDVTSRGMPEGAAHPPVSESPALQTRQAAPGMRTSLSTAGATARGATASPAIRQPDAPQALHRPALAPAWPEHYGLDMPPSVQREVSAHPGTFAIAGYPHQWILRAGKAYRVVLDARNATYTIVNWRDSHSAPPYPVRYDPANREWRYHGEAEPGAVRSRDARDRDVHQIVGHLSMHDLLLQQRQMLACQWGMQLRERVRTAERRVGAAQRAFDNARRAAQDGAQPQADLAGLHAALRARQLSAIDERAAYRGFIRLQPSLHLQRQRYGVWHVTHELTGTRPRTDPRTIGLVPRAAARGAPTQPVPGDPVRHTVAAAAVAAEHAPAAAPRAAPPP